MKIIGLDYGEARIGVAVSDIFETIASPLDTVSEKDYEKQLQRVLEVIRREGAEKIVVGLPMRMDGSMGHRAEVTRAFAEELSERSALPFIMWDERLSSAEAHRTLELGGVSGKKRKTKVDKIAAVLILQTYLDSQIHR